MGAKMSKHRMMYITGDDATEQSWHIIFSYNEPVAATRQDPAEGGDFEFLTATSITRVMTFDAWQEEFGVDVAKLEEEAFECMADDDEAENGPRNDLWLEMSGMTDVQRHVPGIKKT